MLMRTGAGEETGTTSDGYRPERQRGFALVLTVLVFCLPLVCIALLSWHTVAQRAPAAPHVAAFDVAEPVAPQDAPAPEEPQLAEKPLPAPLPQPVAPPPRVVMLQNPVSPPPAPAQAAKVVEAAPATPPASPVQKRRPSGGSDGPDTWHARVLARLNAVKTYPASARARRQQGTVLMRFTVNRQGQVLSVALQKSSGFAPLDREALALPKRTSPLPAPPDDVVGNEIALSVPVEFYF